MRPWDWITALTIVLSLPGYVFAKSYSVESIHSSVEVRTDASIRVTETMPYNFHGKFTFAYRDIPLKEGERRGSRDKKQAQRSARSCRHDPRGFFRSPCCWD